MPDPRRTSFEPLEQRLSLSVAPLAAAPAHVSVVASLGVKRNAAPTLSVADRQELLNNWVGSDAATLRTLLANGDTAGFDNELLSYMRNRTNVHYFFDPNDATGILNFINSDSGLVNQKNAKIAKADNILNHMFPELVGSSTYGVQLPAGTVDWINQPASSTNTEFRYTLNRHFFWNDLAMAYRFTGDSRM